MKKTLVSIGVMLASSTYAASFSGNDASSTAMGNTGVASATPQAAYQYNPSLLADYSAEDDFAITLLGVKSYIDDSEGFINSAENFTEDGGTWDQFQTIDSDALEASIDAIPVTIDNITGTGGDIEDIEAAVTAIGNATNQGELDTAVANLNTASASLTANAAILDTDVVDINTQLTNLNNTTTSANDDLNALSGKPLQLGLGIDLLNVALPSEKLGWAVSFSSDATIGASLTVSDEDMQPILELTGDLTGYSTKATELTAAVNALAVANQALADHFTNAPAFGDAGYAAWESELTTKQDAVIDASDEVIVAQNELETYNGDNGAIVNGEIVLEISEDLVSEIDIVGANVSNVGVSLAKRFTIKGEELAIGITPKMQFITVFEKTIVLSDASDEGDAISDDPTGYFSDNSTNLFRVNLDAGVAKTFDYHGKVRVGAALKDIIPWTLETDQGTELKIRPKLRIGAAHQTSFSTVSLDLDVTENKPLKYGVPTRYIGLGAELRAFQHAAIRVGYRNNLSVDDSHVFSTGLGLTPFGVGLDVSAWAKPGATSDWTAAVEDAGFAIQLSGRF